MILQEKTSTIKPQRGEMILQEKSSTTKPQRGEMILLPKQIFLFIFNIEPF
jgi:hypothetical protein